MLILLLIFFLLQSITGAPGDLSTAIIDNKIYTISYNYGAKIYQVSVCDLDKETLENIDSSCKSYDLINPDEGFQLEIFELPESISEGNKKLWLKTRLDVLNIKSSNSIYHNWMGYIDLTNMKLNAVPNKIKKPMFDKFPIFGYTMNTITNEYGSALYVVGGHVNVSNISYSEGYSNSFYKYNFTTEIWEDMALITKGELPVISSSRLVNIDNRYLYLLGGLIESNTTISPNLQRYSNTKSIYNSPYNLRVFDTFTNTWESVHLDIDVMDTYIEKLQLFSFSLTVYNDKVYTPVGYTTLSGFRNNEFSNKLGILDLKTRKWNWTPLINEDGANISNKLMLFNTIKYNDQIIISQKNPGNNSRIERYILDLPSQRMKSSLKLPVTTNNNQPDKENNSKTKESTSALPTYAIVLIVVGSVIVLLLILFFIYIKLKRKNISLLNFKSKRTEQMQEVWAIPDATNTQNLSELDKPKDSNNEEAHTRRESFASKILSNNLQKIEST